MKTAKMLSCWVKILYYIVLISYHVCDSVFDWLNYFELHANKSFPGFVEDSFFCFSCPFGSLISLGMIVVYGYYITFHGECLYRGCRGYKTPSPCNRRFNDFELLFSILELCKYAMQSYILYRVLEERTCKFLAFALFSLLAHSKLCSCFITKLCGCGVGEESCWRCESDPCGYKVVKVFACLTGLIASGICIYFTIVSIGGSFSAPEHIFKSVAECFHAAKTN